MPKIREVGRWLARARDAGRLEAGPRPDLPPGGTSGARRLAGRVKWWLEGGMDLFYPAVCRLCEAEPASVEDGYVGVGCRKSVRRVEPPFCERCGLPFTGRLTTRFECSNCRGANLQFRCARAAAVADGPVRAALHLYKYHRALWFEVFLAGLLIEAARPGLVAEPCDLIVPVPLHPLKQREREFNQAERLARRLARATGLPVRTDLLRRWRFTDSQTHLDRATRAANVRRAFAVRPGHRLHGERVILLDDVLTTGATASACAAVLRRAGAGPVRVWTVARGT